MMIILGAFVWSALDAGNIYRVFRKKHLLFDDRYSKTMGTALSSVTSLVIALYLTLLLPPSWQIPAAAAGLWVGWKFGSFMKAPASLAGIYHGAMGGIMGMMLGAVILNPALCKVPIDTETMIRMNLYTLTIFCACLHALVIRLVRHSLKA
ncbi:hypothetical protein [Bhargavaea cecembensis]|uniref:hypothetical protein n=1 Tax=Bhargavaea cecembensis TaxID=394098 RepID=UPI0005906AD0|nr:hypothetical protein [Bhargavaea cecembensis]